MKHTRNTYRITEKHPDRIQGILDGFRSGKSIYSLTITQHVSRQYIKRILHENGLLSFKEEDKIRNAVEEGVPDHEIRKLFHISQEDLYLVKRTAKVPSLESIANHERDKFILRQYRENKGIKFTRIAALVEQKFGIKLTRQRVKQIVMEQGHGEVDTRSGVI